MIEEFEKNELYQEVINWIIENDTQFLENKQKLYDERNLQRIKRYAGTPNEYIEERMELNKDVLKNYHKLHHTIILAGFTGFYALILSQTILNFIESTTVTHFSWKYFIMILLLVLGALIAVKIRFTYLILKWTGLLKVIRDSEIEVFYLSKIKQSRESQ
jgi:hypothetical protein